MVGRCPCSSMSPCRRSRSSPLGAKPACGDVDRLRRGECGRDARARRRATRIREQPPHEKPFGLRELLRTPPSGGIRRSPYTPLTMRALVTGGTGQLGAAIARRLGQEGWRVFAAGTKDGDLVRAGRGAGARRAGRRRARRARPPRQRGGSGFRAQARRGGNRGRLGRGARRDRQGQLLRHAGRRAAPARRAAGSSS